MKKLTSTLLIILLTVTVGLAQNLSNLSVDYQSKQIAKNIKDEIGDQLGHHNFGTTMSLRGGQAWFDTYTTEYARSKARAAVDDIETIIYEANQLTGWVNNGGLYQRLWMVGETHLLMLQYSEDMIQVVTARVDI